MTDNSNNIIQSFVKPNGYYDESGNLLFERCNDKDLQSLTADENLKLKIWTENLKKDFPEMDITWCEWIAYYCIKEPDKAEAYYDKNKNKKQVENIKKSQEVFNKIEKENDNIIKVQI